MTLRWTDEQLEAHRKRMGGAKGSKVRIAFVRCDDHYSKSGDRCVLPKYHDSPPEYKIVANTIAPVAKSKFSNVKTGKHASKKESKRAAELRLMEKAGTISDLQEQVRFELIPRQMIDGKVVERAIVYVADFCYRDADGGLVVNDVKGYRTPVYLLKRKLMLFRHGIRILET